MINILFWGVSVVVLILAYVGLRWTDDAHVHITLTDDELERERGQDRDRAKTLAALAQTKRRTIR